MGYCAVTGAEHSQKRHAAAFQTSPQFPIGMKFPEQLRLLSAQLRPAHPFSTDGRENVKTTNAAHSLVNERRRLNGAEIHCARVPSCPISDEPNSPPEAPARPWAELGPQKPASAWCTMPSNHNRGRWLNLLCTAFKKTNPHSYCRGDPADCIRSLHGTRGCLEGRQGSMGGCLGCCLLGTAL